MSAAVLLIDPKYPHNVGHVVRACAALGAPALRWTGDRVTGRIGTRLPREERLAAYKERVDFREVANHDRPLEHPIHWGMTPVCVEVSDKAEPLDTFIHPERAVYVFGPEDGGVPKGIRTACHRFVTIPIDIRCLNLAAAVGVVLWDRRFKERNGQLCARCLTSFT